ncbi:MAG: hypothetical protein GX995_08335 [Clostridiales bacterium]|nr:hypothetical protein [Clostridiales bacterium]
MKKLRDELYKRFKGTNRNKRYYFLWKNGLDTNKNKYSDMSQEEFKEIRKLTDTQFNNLVSWENERDYIELLFMLTDATLNKDLLDAYEAIREKAKEEGTGATVKAFLDLQKVIKQRNVIEETDKEIEEDELEI